MNTLYIHLLEIERIKGIMTLSYTSEDVKKFLLYCFSQRGRRYLLVRISFSVRVEFVISARLLDRFSERQTGRMDSR